MYPSELSGPLYPKGLPIWTEDELEQIINEHKVDKYANSRGGHCTRRPLAPKT